MKIIKFFIKSSLYILLLVIAINIYMLIKTYFYILIEKDLEKKNKKVEAILILGAGVYTDRPSYILEERLQTGINLYKKGIAPKIIMTGDHGKIHYNEVQVMKDYAIERGVPSEDIFMDHAGFSTYESMARLNKIFNVKSAIIVTQKYHLPRALYLARAFKIDVLGVPANKKRYRGQWYRSSREFLARTKDFFIAHIKPKWYIGGELIPLNQSGDITND
ncbi:SanA/YdcF family protein [Fusobacterium russii]|uniref:SanA/YdcF family protein n=1 Tax=Fusobacterium russii TaxID=854 RepID=UPI00039BDA0E|nr:YdcF family protein [Fusobacterium russii]